MYEGMKQRIAAVEDGAQRLRSDRWTVVFRDGHHDRDQYCFKTNNAINLLVTDSESIMEIREAGGSGKRHGYLAELLNSLLEV